MARAHLSRPSMAIGSCQWPSGNGLECMRLCRYKTYMKSASTASSRGQAVIEAVLLIVLFLGVSFFIQREFRRQELLATLVSKPWVLVQNLVEHGGWKNKPSQHPNFHSRHSSPWPKASEALGEAGTREPASIQASQL